MAPHSSTLAQKISWIAEPGRLQSIGSQESDTTERLHFHFSLSCIGEGNGHPLQCSCLENPRDGGAWWAAVYGVAESDMTEATQQRGHFIFSFLRNVMKKANWLSEEDLQMVEKRREVRGKGEKERYTYLNAEFQRIAKRDQRVFLNDRCREIQGNNRMGNIKEIFKKITDIKGTLHAKMGTIKDRNGKDLRNRRD